MKAVERIRRRKLSDDVFEQLKDFILTGELAVGDILPSERDLMERFGVGRPAIREALQALSGLGLINISHGERARITALTPEAVFRQIDLPAKLLLSASSQSLTHLLEARLFFERGMVRDAASKATAAQVAELRDNIRRQTDALSDIDSFIAIDMEFHTSIARIVANPIYIAVSQAILVWIREYHTERLHWTGRENVTLAEHTEIVDRIAAADPDGADEAIIRHLERSSALYRHKADIEAEAALLPVLPARRRRAPVRKTAPTA